MSLLASLGGHGLVHVAIRAKWLTVPLESLSAETLWTTSNLKRHRHDQYGGVSCRYPADLCYLYAAT
jgi:hypothetical protein